MIRPRRYVKQDLPQKKVCPNCNNTWREGDRYCRYCGALMDNPAFITASYSTIYGPMPMDRTHLCTACGYKWTTHLMIDREAYCPECGAKAPVVRGENSHEPEGILFGIDDEEEEW